MNERLQEKRDQLKELEAWRKKLKAGKVMKSDTPPAKMPKTLELTQAKICKLKSTIDSETIKISNKDANKEVALGTSKINYMDPRITIAWCKQVECPIEKVFPKTLRSKFAWAMNSGYNWQF